MGRITMLVDRVPDIQGATVKVNSVSQDVIDRICSQIAGCQTIANLEQIHGVLCRRFAPQERFVFIPHINKRYSELILSRYWDDM